MAAAAVAVAATVAARNTATTAAARITMTTAATAVVIGGVLAVVAATVNIRSKGAAASADFNRISVSSKLG